MWRRIVCASTFILPSPHTLSSYAWPGSIATLAGSRPGGGASIFIMTELAAANRAETLFADFAPTPVEHFRLHFFGAVLVCIEYAAVCSGSFQSALDRFPFLIGYNNELAQRLDGLSSEEAF